MSSDHGGLGSSFGSGRSQANSLLSQASTADTVANRRDRTSWVPDGEAQDCAVCFTRFTIKRRRHHCRLCGGVVCSSCSESRVFLVEGGKLERACNACVTAAPRLRKACTFMQDLNERLDGFRPQDEIDYRSKGSAEAGARSVIKPGEHRNPDAVPSKEELDFLMESVADATNRLESAWKSFEDRSIRREQANECQSQGSSVIDLPIDAPAPVEVSNRCTRKCVVM